MTFRGTSEVMITSETKDGKGEKLCDFDRDL